jgi:hypothetical protein
MSETKETSTPAKEAPMTAETLTLTLAYLAALAARAGRSTHLPRFERELDRVFLAELRAGRREGALARMRFLDDEVFLNAAQWEGEVADPEERRCLSALQLKRLYAIDLELGLARRTA